MSGKFTETKIATKFGMFYFRVYAATSGKETVVLYTEKLNPKVPVLVRVHSECMTGDLFGSLQCDCGEQLARSLEMINRSKNGMLIYLRQEGRGIGLFEKIKSYQLQEKGYDTFEANLLLGHEPDARTYEMAKSVLNDFHIKSINLITNNPSKISEIAKYGIKIVERIPIIISSNKHNQRYFATKKDKFKHFFHAEVSYYFYQFHVDAREQVDEMGKFLKDKKADPLLKICVGVSANHNTLSDANRIKQIESIFQACTLYEGFVPILHFSFSKSSNPVIDVKNIKKLLPFVKYIQVNDLKPVSINTIKLICKSFLADIPLSDDDFNIVHKNDFRKIVQKYKAFILLDNSKGTGIRESKESLKGKIDILLSYGLNDIAIFGGFGPDDLDTYFELRRNYKINFSIDAETKLKTDGQIDLNKTKQYILQLIRFDDPKKAGIEQTKTFIQQNRQSEWQKISMFNKQFLVHPAVFNPGKFPSTEWFTNEVNSRIKGEKNFCEVGCGSGVTSCLIAINNPKINVVATDINPFASSTTKTNAKNLGIESRISVFTGDVLDNIDYSSKFDTIFWALPFGFLDPGTAVNYEDMQVFDPGYRALRKFFQTAKKYLTPKGKLLIGFSTDLGHFELLKELAKESGLKIKIVANTKIKEEETLKFEILEGKYSV